VNSAINNMANATIEQVTYWRTAQRFIRNQALAPVAIAQSAI
jgi:hypothetical protein